MEFTQLRFNSSTGALEYHNGGFFFAPTLSNPVSASAPGGATGTVQYNNSGVFGGISELTTDGTRTLTPTTDGGLIILRATGSPFRVSNGTFDRFYIDTTNDLCVVRGILENDIGRLAILNADLNNPALITDLDASGSRIINLLDPTSPQDAATKNYAVHRAGDTLTGALLEADGNSGAPAYSFSNETSMGMWRNGSGSVSVSASDGGFLQSTDGSMTIGGSKATNMIFLQLAAGGVIAAGGILQLNASTATTAIGPTLSDFSEFIAVDALGGAIAVSLPDVMTPGLAGLSLTIKKIDVSANAVTVTAFGGGTIDGAASFVLATQYKSVTIVSDPSGTNDWFVIAKI